MSKNDKKAKKIFWTNLLSYILIFALASLCSYFFTSIIIQSKDAINLIASVFSILSGFLFMIIAQSIVVSLKSDNLNLTEKQNQKERFEMRFTRLTILFISYLIVLFLIFVYFVLKEIPEYKSTIEGMMILNGSLTRYFIAPPISLTNDIILWSLKVIPHIFIGIAFISFMYSLRLPWALKAIADEERTIKNKSQ